jgi:hypothetical protein
MKLDFILTYEGALSDAHQIDFYDVSQALIGFQRSIALTTHLVLNNQVITQAPSLKGAVILAEPPQSGSWKMLAKISLVGTAFYNTLTADKETVLGNLVTSAYDYVISESLGFHVDFNKTLNLQYQELHAESQEAPGQDITSRLDSVVEKCEAAVKHIHRPIVESRTASGAIIHSLSDGIKKSIGHPFDQQTYEYLDTTIKSENLERFVGKVSSYNANTYKGRIYLPEFGRPLPFMLAESAKTRSNAGYLAANLATHAETRFRNDNFVTVHGYRLSSKTGRLKGLLIFKVEILSGL